MEQIAICNRCKFLTEFSVVFISAEFALLLYLFFLFLRTQLVCEIIFCEEKCCLSVINYFVPWHLVVVL